MAKMTPDFNGLPSQMMQQPDMPIPQPNRQAIRASVLDQQLAPNSAIPNAVNAATQPPDTSRLQALQAQLTTPQGGLPALGQYANRLEGFSSDKLNNGRDSPKYQIGRVLSQFDPSQGLTPELLNALNALGIGDFTSNGRDKVSVANADPRFQDLTELDLIRGYNQGGLGWQYGVENAAAPTAGPGVSALVSQLMTPRQPPVSTPPAPTPVPDQAPSGDAGTRVQQILQQLRSGMMQDQLGGGRGQF